MHQHTHENDPSRFPRASWAGWRGSAPRSASGRVECHHQVYFCSLWCDLRECGCGSLQLYRRVVRRQIAVALSVFRPQIFWGNHLEWCPSSDGITRPPGLRCCEPMRGLLRTFPGQTPLQELCKWCGNRLAFQLIISNPKWLKNEAITRSVCFGEFTDFHREKVIEIRWPHES